MKKFEERLERLEELAQKIKESDLPLEEAFAVFEEGIKLSKGLERDLEKMQGKVEILVGTTSGEDGEEKPELDLFESDDEEEDE
jgi:exodeoxyribonuclease VII small subunit